MAQTPLQDWRLWPSGGKYMEHLYRLLKGMAVLSGVGIVAGIGAALIIYVGPFSGFIIGLLALAYLIGAVTRS